MLLAGVGGAFWWGSSRSRSDESSGEANGQGGWRRDPSARVSRATVPTSSDGLVPWLHEPSLPRRRIAGVVRAKGAPVAGARVELQLAMAPDVPTRVAPVETDGAGKFDLGEQPAAHYVVVAMRDGLRPGSVVVVTEDPDAEPDPAALVIELDGDCAQRTFGVVLDGDGRPLAGARVHAYSRETVARLPVAVTGTDGRFDVCTSGYKLVVSADGHETRSVMVRFQPSKGWEIRLFAAGTIEGRVVDLQGHPVEGALVGLGRFMRDTHAVSGPDGSFRMGNVPAGRHSLGADHPDHGQSEGTIVFVVPGQSASGVLIELSTPCRRIAGRVLLDGAPLPGAFILGAYTQADGSFVARCAGTIPMDIHVAGYIVGKPSRLPSGEDPIDDLLVEVTRGGILRGTVTADGKPVAGANVGKPFSMSAMMSGEAMLQARTGADGRYELTGVQPGAHELAARDPVSGRRSARVAVETSPGRESVVDFDLSITATVAGTVADSAGKPVPGVQVQLTEPGNADSMAFGNPFQGSTDAAGAFRIVGVRPGAYVAKVGDRLDGFKPLGGAAWPTVVIMSSDQHVELQIKLADRVESTMAGHVRYEDGRPAANARVFTFANETYTDPDGSFRMSGGPGPGGRLQAITTDGASAEVSDVKAGQADLDIVVAFPGSIEATIASSGDDWIASVHAASDKRGREVWGSDVRGSTFRATNLPPGEYSVKVEGPAGAGGATVKVVSREVARVTIPVGDVVRVTGIVRMFPGGEPAADVNCSVGSSNATSSADGSFTLEGIPLGQATIACMSLPMSGAPGWRMGRASVEITKQTPRVEVWVVATSPDSLDTGTVGDLGASLMPSGPAGLALAKVVPDGPAGRAGLRDGDVLVTVDGGPATGSATAAVEAYLRSRVPGTTVVIAVRRAGQDVRAEVILGERSMIE